MLLLKKKSGDGIAMKQRQGPFVHNFFELNKAAVDQIRSNSYHFGYGQFSEAVFYRTYSLYHEDIDHQEDFYDVVLRCTNGQFSIRKDHYLKHGIKWDEAYWQDFATRSALAFLKLKWCPPGRGWSKMGTQYIYNRGSMCLNNCAFSTVENLSHDCGWIMDCLMLGCGVGFSVTEQPLFIKEPNRGLKTTFVIPDSREGWVEGLELLIRSYEEGTNTIEFDASEVRPKGAPIKGFGGTASGPEPLIKLYESTRETLERYLRKEITPTRAKADIVNMIGCCVVAGNVRRSAEIMLGSINNPEFIDLKQYSKISSTHRIAQEAEDCKAEMEGREASKIMCSDPFCRCTYGWMSNNSVILTETEDFMSLPEIAERIKTNGEPGLINMKNIRKYGRYGKEVQTDHAIGINPCVTEDTWTMTADGPRQVADIIDWKTDLVVNGIVYETEGFFETGTKKICQIETKEGYALELTPDHKVLRVLDKSQYAISTQWTEAKDLKPNDRIMISNHREITGWDGPGDDSIGLLLGHWIGDGTYDHDKGFILCSWGESEGSISVRQALDFAAQSSCEFRSDWKGFFQSTDHYRLCVADMIDVFSEFGIEDGTKKITIEIESASCSFYKGFIRGLFDADGSVQGHQGKGISVRLAQSDKPLLQAVQRMLIRLGIYSTIYHRRPAGYKELPDGKGGVKEYYCKNQYELMISKDNLIEFNDVIGFTDLDKSQKLYNLLGSYARTPNRERFIATIQEIVYLDEEKKVYDIQVPGVNAFCANGLYVHNCGEIPLENKELCNLGEQVPVNNDSLEDFLQCCEFSSTYMQAVSLLPTHRPETNIIIAKNRRNGGSITGIADWQAKENYTTITKWMKEGYWTHRKTNNRLAKESKVVPAIRVTTIKPSGTISKVIGVCSGIHPPLGRYVLRRMVLPMDSPIEATLKASDYPIEDCVYDDNSTVVEFPLDFGDARPFSEVPMHEQAMMAEMGQREWSDNALSVTIYYKQEEEKYIEHMIAQIAPVVKTLSVLPADKKTYEQAPEEVIDEQTYNEMKAKVKDIDWSTFTKSYGYEQADSFCTGDSCEL